MNLYQFVHCAAASIHVFVALIKRSFIVEMSHLVNMECSKSFFNLSPAVWAVSHSSWTILGGKCCSWSSIWYWCHCIFFHFVPLALALQKDISTFSNYLQKEEGKHFHFLLGWNYKTNTLTFSNSNRNKFSPPDSKWCGHMAGKTPQLLCPYTPEKSYPLNFALFLVPIICDSELIDNLPSIASFLSLPATRLSSFSTPASLWRDVPGGIGQKRKSLNCLQLDIYTSSWPKPEYPQLLYSNREQWRALSSLSLTSRTPMNIWNILNWNWTLKLNWV